MLKAVYCVMELDDISVDILNNIEILYYSQIFNFEIYLQRFFVVSPNGVLWTVATKVWLPLHPILHIKSPRFFFVLIQSVWSVTVIISSLHSFLLMYSEFVWLQNDGGYVLLSQPRLPLLAVYHMGVWICESCQLDKCLLCLSVFKIICMVPTSVIWPIVF